MIIFEYIIIFIITYATFQWTNNELDFMEVNKFLNIQIKKKKCFTRTFSNCQLQYDAICMAYNWNKKF